MVSALSLRLGVKPVIRGLEYIAELPGPFIFVANHPSELDAPLIQQALAGAPRAGVGRERHSAIRTVVVGVQPAIGAAGVAEKLLRLRSGARLTELLGRGVSVVLFAEKTRSDDGSLTQFDRGAAQLGIQTGVTLVPVTLGGTFRALPPWRRTPEAGRPVVTVTFGRPIQIDAGDESTSVTAKIVKAITLGLAEESSGWYGALRSEAENSLPTDEQNSPAAAHWRRIWGATAPRPETRRRVWVDK
ncbi:MULTISPECIES: lysophospholipid acyltransferase family protein [Subtercola]|uniref:1-acyl-sn-glycerol-3-phosphate acyltransferase n=1 Tax=Subtercola vilae TaxID=2056433 RepID=A0A4V4RH36_9MICO|nr:MULTISPECIES: lysophospholipid acyltransferase family protein [Subtercola]MEA9984709.1 lysophospholipid acyltransferase family protein [Subtercola sp. RTI3]TIH39044.1 1-acyl-sn-glycerol-3-phosphate acyltransferase [Subtercola vilae]